MRHCSSFRGSRCALVALVVGAAASISCAQPQECQIQIPDCTGIPYLLTGETWKNNTAWKSNRLPGVSFQLMTGNFCAQQPE